MTTTQLRRVQRARLAEHRRTPLREEVTQACPSEQAAPMYADPTGQQASEQAIPKRCGWCGSIWDGDHYGDRHSATALPNETTGIYPSCFERTSHELPAYRLAGGELVVEEAEAGR